MTKKRDLVASSKEGNRKHPNRNLEVAGRNWVESEESAKKGRYSEQGASLERDQETDATYDADQSEAV